jgi:hypothetical protein
MVTLLVSLGIWVWQNRAWIRERLLADDEPVSTHMEEN